jgi:hypothetical protein
MRVFSSMCTKTAMGMTRFLCHLALAPLTPVTTGPLVGLDGGLRQITELIGFSPQQQRAEMENRLRRCRH